MYGIKSNSSVLDGLNSKKGGVVRLYLMKTDRKANCSRVTRTLSKDDSQV